MIIWRGRGILVAIIAIAVLVLMQLVFDGANGEGYYQTHAFPKVLVGLIAGVPIWFLGKKWNDESGGGHELFFVPMQYWAFVILAVMLWTAAFPSEASKQMAAGGAAPVTEPAPEPEPTPAAAQPVAAAVVPPPQPVETAKPEVQKSQVQKVQEPPAETRPAITYVYADNASGQYYPEKCAGRPQNAFRINRSIAIAQGYALAAGCSEEPRKKS